MIAIKSLWTKPSRWRHSGAEELWSLSILRLVKFYGSVTIHTDELGELWLRALRLPGNITISRLLDDLASYDPHVWALGKLYTAMNQREPFIATDGDVILGRCLPRRIHEATVCAEKLYTNPPKLKPREGKPWGEWFAKCEAPGHWKDAVAEDNGISFNCGLFGGCDTYSIRQIAATGFEFAIRNAATLRGVRSDIASIVCEEWAIAREFDPLEVSCLTAMGEHGNELLTRARSYWHQPGGAKINPEVQARVREKLEAELPGQVARCREVARSIPARNSHF